MFATIERSETERGASGLQNAVPRPGASVCIAGASLDTGNLGVSALAQSVIQGIAARLHGRITLLDNGLGLRESQVCGDGRSIPVELCGARLTRRFYRAEAYGRIRLAARLGGLRNQAARRLLSADAVLDISGGDSFTDLYGARRFRQICLPKLIATENRRRLILLPQTYGPFSGAASRRIASDIVGRSAMAWARDARSFEVLRELLSERFNPARHRLGVDVAFALQATDPKDQLPREVRAILKGGERPIGLNVSGLIYHDPESARGRYGFTANYREAVAKLLMRLLEHSTAPLLLIPHVLTPPGHYESDSEASRLLRQCMPASLRERVVIVPSLDASSMKWVIATCEWFCGTRMHSTIASLSSGVPSAAISYSDKTLGVFETCGQGDHVADPRRLSTDEVIDQVWRSWMSRAAAGASLAQHLPGVFRTAECQLNEIAAAIDRTGAESPA